MQIIRQICFLLTNFGTPFQRVHTSLIFPCRREEISTAFPQFHRKPAKRSTFSPPIRIPELIFQSATFLYFCDNVVKSRRRHFWSWAPAFTLAERFKPFPLSNCWAHSNVHRQTFQWLFETSLASGGIFTKNKNSLRLKICFPKSEKKKNRNVPK